MERKSSTINFRRPNINAPPIFYLPYHPKFIHRIQSKHEDLATKASEKLHSPGMVGLEWLNWGVNDGPCCIHQSWIGACDA
jgi:hypothetical protein